MALARALDEDRLRSQNQQLREELGYGRLLGHSTAMTDLRETISKVAKSEATVLISGESGTGKELVARAIHYEGFRAGHNFVAVNCGALVGSLLESELFGHIRGSFTGASADKQGLFVAADRGSLFLDEIGELPLELQPKSLRALQEGEVRPVGASKPTKVNTRVIAATNRNLAETVEEKKFREDLYYRLNVLVVHVPPLSRRTEDIPLLAHHFLARTCEEMNLPQKDLTPEVLAFLVSRAWPGNVREMQNFMRRLAVFATGQRVDLNMARMAGGTTPVPDRPTSLPPYKDAKARMVDDFTRAYVRELLATTDGNVSQAARTSGLERVSLQKILKRLGIDADEFR